MERDNVDGEYCCGTGTVCDQSTLQCDVHLETKRNSVLCNPSTNPQVSQIL
jgi:hypothetical protein